MSLTANSETLEKMRGSEEETAEEAEEEAAKLKVSFC